MGCRNLQRGNGSRLGVVGILKNWKTGKRRSFWGCRNLQRVNGGRFGVVGNYRGVTAVVGVT